MYYREVIVLIHNFRERFIQQVADIEGSFQIHNDVIDILMSLPEKEFNNLIEDATLFLLHYTAHVFDIEEIELKHQGLDFSEILLDTGQDVTPFFEKVLEKIKEQKSTFTHFDKIDLYLKEIMFNLKDSIKQEKDLLNFFKDAFIGTLIYEMTQVSAKDIIDF